MEYLPQLCQFSLFHFDKSRIVNFIASLLLLLGYFFTLGRKLELTRLPMFTAVPGTLFTLKMPVEFADGFAFVTKLCCFVFFGF